MISILIPVKNAEGYFRECLDSILAQTEENWELIIVNDGSTDRSRGIALEYATKDERITVLDNEGTGIIEALRTAYKHCSGELITRMDADDIMPLNKLETLQTSLQKHGTGHVATGLVKYFAADGIKPGYQHYEGWLNDLTRTGSNYSDVYRECVIPSPCWMTYRSDLDNCEAFNPDRYPEDYNLAFRFMQQGLKVIPCNEVLHFWRDHSERTSRNHPHYQDNRFLELKLNWFLELSHDPAKTLVVWGAASKGKLIARKLIEAEVDFRWMCNNPNKINKTVYNTLIEDVADIKDIADFQAIILVANKDEQAEIRAQLTREQAFFFC